jgi:hypothetical protein
MTRRRFARPCSFSSRKTARRYGFQGLLNLLSLSLRFQGFAAKDRKAVENNQLDYDWYEEGGEDSTLSELAFMRLLKHVAPRLELLGFRYR